MTKITESERQFMTDTLEYLLSLPKEDLTWNDRQIIRIYSEELK